MAHISGPPGAKACLANKTGIISKLNQECVEDLWSRGAEEKRTWEEEEEDEEGNEEEEGCEEEEGHEEEEGAWGLGGGVRRPVATGSQSMQDQTLLHHGENYRYFFFASKSVIWHYC